MTELTRRNLLSGAAAATAATALTPLASSPANSAAPAVGKQVPGYYRYKVGSFEVTVVTDGINRFKFPDAFVANKTRDEVNAALAAAYMEKDMMAIPYCPIVVNTGDKLVVIDTGDGAGQFRAQQGRCRPVPFQSRRRRHRSQRDRCGGDLALPSPTT